MNNKKKNLKTARTLPEIVDACIYDFDNQTLNGIPIQDILDRLSSDPKLPPGMHGACHICNPIKYFYTLDETTKHVRDKHMIWKG